MSRRDDEGVAPRDAEEQMESLVGKRVTALAPLRGKAGLVSVRVGSRTLGAVEVRDVADLGVRVGAEVTEALAARVRRAAAIAKAKDAAMRKIVRRGKSSAQLLDDLLRAGHDKETAREAVDRLRGAGLVDDKALAESYAKQVMSRSASGKRLVEARLRGKRFSPEVAAEAAKSAAGERDALEDATALARKKIRAAPKSIDAPTLKRRVWAALARRGFDADVCRKALEKAMGKDTDVDE